VDSASPVVLAEELAKEIDNAAETTSKVNVSRSNFVPSDLFFMIVILDRERLDLSAPPQ